MIRTRAPSLQGPTGDAVLSILEDALASVDPERTIARCTALDGLPSESALWVAGVGKAVVPATRGLLERFGPRIAGGLAVAKRGAAGGGACGRVVGLEAAHPVPDASSVEAGRRLLELAAGRGPDEVLICPISGGASALACAPHPPITLDDLARTTSLLLGAGVDIVRFNTVRKHLDRFKGGGLARAARRSRVLGLVLSDVVEGDLDMVGSGPTLGDRSTFADALAVVDEVGRARFPGSVVAHLEAGARGRVRENPRPQELPWAGTVKLADNETAVAAALASAARRGWSTSRLPTLRGEAREAGASLGATLREMACAGGPRLAVAGGETVVTLRGSGKGGRCQELALAAAIELAGVPGVALVAFATDGEDGPTDAAGAVVTGETLARSLARGLDAQRALASNDAYSLLDGCGELLRTGPTGTNVCDIVLLVSAPDHATT